MSAIHSFTIIRFHISYINLILLTIIPFYMPKTSALRFDEKSNFDHQECRSWNKWKGDNGELPIDDNSLEVMTLKHPKNILKVLSRKKRFLSFPSGSTVTVKSEWSIPKNSHDRHDLSLLVGIPFTLNLPENKLSLGQIFGKGEEEEEPEEEDSYYTYIKRKRRDVDQQRKTAFEFIESMLDSLGLPGRSCLLKAVCESAEEPIDDSLGMLGEVMDMFLSASFGGGMEEMNEFIEAEEVGRNNATCNNLYTDCPFHLADFLYSGMSIIQSGLIGANDW